MLPQQHRNTVSKPVESAPTAEPRTEFPRLQLRHPHAPGDAAGGWVIDNLFRAVGAGGALVTMRHLRRELHACAESLKRWAFSSRMAASCAAE